MLPKIFLDLRQSALISLTTLLKVESKTSLSNSLSSVSIKSVLDNMKTTQTITTNESSSRNEANARHNLWKNTFSKSKINIFEESYIDKIDDKLRRFTKNKTKEIIKKNAESELEDLTGGAELCRTLLYIYNTSIIQNKNRKQHVITNTFACILGVSEEAKKFALQNNFLETIIQQLKELHEKLSMESVECLKRVSDQKRLSPKFRDLADLVGLITNFMIGSECVKSSASLLGFQDFIHKLWVWLCVNKTLLIDALKMLCTFTTDSYLGMTKLF